MIRDPAPLPGYREPYGLLCAILQDATEEWRGELQDDLGPEIITWRVRPGGQTIGAIMLHMISVEVFWLERFVLGTQLDVAERDQLMVEKIDVDESLWPDPHPEPLSWYFALHDRIRARTLEAIKSWPPPDTIIRSRPEAEGLTPTWVLGHVIQHESYHGGQILLMHDLWKNQQRA